MSEVLFALSQAAAWIPGAELVGDAQAPVRRVHTDTRSLQVGDCFVALRGERFDGHDFLPQLGTLGVHVAIAERGLAEAGLSGLQVNDTREALGQLAQGWRAAHAVGLIAVTGSNGKTTVTQMIAAILRAHCGEAALSTQGNLNNDIGVPLTLLRVRDHHRLAVLELGMNHPGEIARLAAWVQPQVALVNNAQREHQEFMHSVRAVALENGAVLQALPANGVAVFPSDDEHTPLWREAAGARTVLTFGADGDVQAMQSARTGLGWTGRMACPRLGIEFEFELAMPGEHNLRNAMAATACALSAGVPADAIARGLSDFRPVAGRSQAQTLQLGQKKITLVDDTYNANPDSVRAAIDVLAQLPAPHVLVLGDMGEVGDQGPEFHAEVGRYARERGIEHLLTHGSQAELAAQAHGQAQHHPSIEPLCAELDRLCLQAGSVLVKGSRFMKMERVVRHLQASQEPATC
jgi:UDP-N-acetylmuramoyl-tripeptide--D-alanyl-D-alanine ligase